MAGPRVIIGTGEMNIQQVPGQQRPQVQIIPLQGITTEQLLQILGFVADAIIAVGVLVSAGKGIKKAITGEREGG